MKAYITKYALTQGIFEIEATVANSTEKMITQSNTRYPTFYHKPYWHETPEEALEHANKMKQDRIASLKKTLAKTEKMTFAMDKIKKR